MTALELIIANLTKQNELKKYVILKKDDEGYYIEYAFTDGAPHDNRCLDWYYSYQPEAYIRNKWFENLSEEEREKRLANIKADREENVGKLYRLYSLTCGGEENPEEQVERALKAYNKYHANDPDYGPFVPEDHICKVGCPAKACTWNCNWSYKNPVKCACWHLADPTTMEDFISNYKVAMKAAELAELLSK
jgi:hypothetical protein